jgi:hypothetical protein
VIKRAILLPDEISTFLLFNKDFAPGSYADKAFRRVFIDKSDIPAGNYIEQDSQVQIGTDLYEVKYKQDFTPIPIIGLIIQRIVLKITEEDSSSSS